MSQHDFGPHIRALSELDDFKIESGDPDPRGWSVVTSAGDHVGTVEDLLVDTARMKVEFFDIRLEPGAAAQDSGSPRAFVAAQDADLSDQRVILHADAALTAGTAAWHELAAETVNEDRRARRDLDDETRVTRAEEELRVGKRDVVRGEARVTKRVETERVSQPVTRRREELVVERRPVEAVTARDASITEEEIRIPLHEDEVVVEKRPVVKEELVVGKRVVEERDTVEADVRRERVEIDGEDRPRPQRGRDEF